MSLTKELATPQYTLLRGQGYAGNMLVSLFSNTVLLHGQTTTDLTGSGSWAQFYYTTISGLYTDVSIDMSLFMGTVDDIKQATFFGRVRIAITNTLIYTNESSIDFPVGTYFWIVNSFVPQYRLSRPSTLNPETAIELVDWDDGFTRPLPAVVGLKTGYAGYVNSAGKLRLGFDVSSSYVVGSGDSLSSYLYYFPGGATVVAGSLASPIVIVDLDPGEQWGHHDLTSTFGTQRRYFGLKVHDDNTNQPDVGFEGGSIEGDISRGWTCSLPAFTGVDDVLPNTCAIVWRANEQYNDTAQALYGGGSAAVTNKALTSNVATLTAAGHPFAVGQEVIVADVDSTFNGTHIITATSVNTFSFVKVHANVVSAAAAGMAVVNPDNVMFVGWFQTESDNTAGDMTAAVKSGATFNFTGVGPRLSRIVAQLLAFQLNASPTLWGQIVNLTVWRGLAHFFSRYTTVTDLCDLTFDSTDNTYLFPTITTQGGNFFNSPEEIAKQIDALLEFGMGGQIAINREVAYLDQTERDALPPIADWTSADGYAVDRQLDPMPNIGRADGDGLFYNSYSGGLPTGYTVRSPGFAQGEPPGSSTLSNQILASTSDTSAALAELEQRIGNKFEYYNLSEFLDWDHPAGYVGVGLIPSRSELFTFTVDDTLAGPNGVNRIVYDTSVLWTIDSVRIAYNVNIGDFAPRIRYRRVPRIGDPGDDTTKVDPGTIAPALPDLGLPSFEFQLPEVTFPDPGLTDVNPIQLLPPPGGIANFNGQELAVKSPTKAFYLKNFITLRVPQARDVTPPDLGSFQIKQILIDPFYTSSAIPAYILASDGTNSAVWYCTNIVSSAPAWTKGVEFSGVYTQIAAGNAAGTILMYAPDAGTAEWNYTFDFTVSDGGWTCFPAAGQCAVWTAGIGWVAQNAIVSGTPIDLIQLVLNFSSTHINSLEVIGYMYDTNNNGQAVRRADFCGVGSCQVGWGLDNVTGPIDATIHPNISTGEIFFAVNSVYSGGSHGIVSALKVQGTGTNPFSVSGDRNLVVVSSDYGVSVNVPSGVGPNPLTIGGFDVQKAGSVSYAATADSVLKSSSFGGTYSSFVDTTGANCVCLVIPYFVRNSTATKNTSTSTPQVIAALDAADGDGGSLYWISGAGVKTDITPVAGMTFHHEHCVTVSYGTHLAVFGSVGGVYKLYTSTDGGATWTFRSTLTTPHFIRDRRNDTRAKQGGSHGQLFLATDGVIDYSSLWAGSGMNIRTMPTSGIDGFDSIF